MKIDYLKFHTEHLPTLASWMFNTWGHFNADSSIEEVEQILNEHLNSDQIPLTFVALENNQPVGMCSVTADEGLRNDFSPWLGSLYVMPEHRRRGIGEQLCRFGITQVKSLGYSKLYLLAFDHSLQHFYESLGWQLTGVDLFDGHSVIVMEVTL